MGSQSCDVVFNRKFTEPRQPQAVGFPVGIPDGQKLESCVGTQIQDAIAALCCQHHTISKKRCLFPKSSVR
jgi:hypothetical protein